MELSDETNALADEAELPEVLDEDAEDSSETDEDKPLGPQGEKALYAEKERRKAADRERRALARKNEQFVARIAELELLAKGRAESGEDEEVDLDAIRQEAADAAKAEAHTELLAERVSLKVEALASKKKFEDPDDALTYLMRTHEIDDFLDDGQVDVEAITEALDELLERKPYLSAAQSGRRFKGGADGGAKPAKPSRPRSLGDAVTRHYNR